MENPIWAFISNRQSKGPQDLVDVIGKVFIFEDLSKTELKRVEQVIHVRQYNRNEIIFAEDEPGVGLYIINKGAVKIYKKDSTGREATLSTLTEGEFFGEMSLLDDFPRSATAVTTEPSVLLGFFQPDLMNLIGRHPSTGCKILQSVAKLLGERLRKTNELLQKHSF